MVEDFTKFYLQSYLLRTPFGKGSHPSSRTGSQEVLHERWNWSSVSFYWNVTIWFLIQCSPSLKGRTHWRSSHSRGPAPWCCHCSPKCPSKSEAKRQDGPKTPKINQTEKLSRLMRSEVGLKKVNLPGRVLGQGLLDGGEVLQALRHFAPRNRQVAGVEEIPVWFFSFLIRSYPV